MKITSSQNTLKREQRTPSRTLKREQRTQTLMKSLFFLLSVYFVCSVGHLMAADRVALVIGVNDYPAFPADRQLTSPLADAGDLAASLKQLGFIVHQPVNGTQRAINNAIQLFQEDARGAQLAVFYFSGHGFQVGDENYLIPGDMPTISSFSVMKSNAIELRGNVMTSLEEAGAGTKVIILDCCRDNPFAKQINAALTNKSLRTKGGTGEISGYGEGFFLAFATSPFNTALDGNGARNSPFTAALLTHLKDKAGENIRVLFDEVKSTVKETNGEEQVPWVTDSLNKAHVKVLARLSTPTPVPGGSQPPMVNRPSPVPSPPADPFATISKNTPFTNSLGMTFVPAGTPGVLFSVWETRVQDFESFVEATDYDAITKSANGDSAYTLEKNADGSVGWEQKGGSWRDPRFPSKQTGEHPVVCVSYLDAEAFCAWLTRKDRASGKIPASTSYRLPTDSEWSRACGSNEFPWGENFPPTRLDGNYSGAESMVGVYAGYSNDLVKAGFKDSAARTAPVGMFGENRFGLHDMGGNVFEWCGTWYTADLNDAEAKKAYPVLADDQGGQAFRVLRGASWINVDRVVLRSSYRNFGHPVLRGDGSGFRCVLVVAGG